MSANNAALNHLKQRRAKSEADEAEVERQVYDLETSYLTDHSLNGNLLRGFEAGLAQTKQQTQKKVMHLTLKMQWTMSAEPSLILEW